MIIKFPQVEKLPEQEEGVEKKLNKYSKFLSDVSDKIKKKIDHNKSILNAFDITNNHTKRPDKIDELVEENIILNDLYDKVSDMLVELGDVSDYIYNSDYEENKEEIKKVMLKAKDLIEKIKNDLNKKSPKDKSSGD